MSVRLSFEARAPARLKSLGSKARVSISLDYVEEVVREHLEERGGWADLLRRSDRLAIALHPAEERLVLWVIEDKVGGQARTSGAGPGYHVAVIELLDHLARRLRLAWDVQDPTGFHGHRDREALERWMAGHLKQVVAGAGAQEQWSVNFPAQRTVVEAPYTIVTPTGPWNVEQAGHIRESTRPEEVAPYFPWWGDRDAKYWHTVGQSLRWMEVIWTPYEPPRQREVREACRDAFLRAAAMDPTLAVPHRELERIDELLTPAPVPVSELVHGRPPPPADFQGGYRLFPHRWTIAGRWSVDLPGDFTQPMPGENGTWTVNGPDSSIFLTPYGSVDPTLQTSQRAARHMVEQLASAATRRGEFIDVVGGGDEFGAAGVLWRAPSGELLLQGAKPAAGTFVLITFVSDADEAPSSWGRVWASLSAS